MGWLLGLGNGVVFRTGSSTAWSSYWLTRKPSNLVASVISATRIDLTWDDASAASDGLKIYLSTDGGATYTYNSTVTFGVEAKSLTGLTAGNTYTIKLVAYKGVNESDAVTTTIYLSTLLTGISAYWPLDELSGNATDLINGKVLTNNNTVTYALAKVASGASTGTANTNKSLTINDLLGLTYDSDKSFAFWFKLLTQPGSLNNSLVSILFATNPGNYLRISIKKAGEIYKITTQTGTDFAITFTVGEWYHIVATWNNSGNEVKLYINADLKYTDAIQATQDLSGLTNQFSIGIFNRSDFSSAVFDEVYVYPRVLIQAEVTESYNSAKANVYPFTKNFLPSSAWCWFNSTNLVYSASANKSFIGLMHNNGAGYTQNIATIDHATGIITPQEIGDVYSYDDHNEPTILIRASDSKLFSVYCNFATALLRYRLSTNALDASAWEAETTIDPNDPSGYVYPSAYQVANGDIYIFYCDVNTARTPIYQWAYIKSTDEGVNFGNDTIFTNNIRYCISAQDETNKNIIHFITSHHPSDGLATSQQTHFYFDAATETFHKSDGTDITADIPFDYPSTTVVQTNADPKQGWIEDITVDSNGYPRVLLTYLPDIDVTPHLKFLMYSEWNGSAWTTPYQIHQSCNKSMALLDNATVHFYAPLACFDKGNPDRIFAAKEISDGGQTEIYELARVSATSFTSKKRTISLFDQWRPLTSNAPTYNVFWLNKKRYYSYENDFNQEMIVRTL